jgi:hypothetical protein
MALSSAVQEALWLRSLLTPLFPTISDQPTVINEDNQGCIELTKTTKNHSRSKHIDIRYHFIKEHIQMN